MTERPLVVAVTGANGVIGTVLLERLAGRHTLVPVTRTTALPGGRVADLSDADGLTRAFEGCEAVVHLAGSAAVESSWQAALDANIVGTYNVLEACRRAGVRRLVFASTNHVVGMLEVDARADGHLYDLDDPRSVDERDDLRPDSLYGVSKAFGEAACRYYVDQHGLEAVCLRIGTVLKDADPTDGGDGRDGPWAGREPHVQRRLRATWLSHRDCAALVDRALVAPTRWAIVYGTSGNHRRLWDLEHAREAIGYVPVDSAPIWLGEDADVDSPDRGARS